MNELESISVKAFFKDMPSRLDGIAALLTTFLFAVIAVAGPVLPLSIGRLAGWNLFWSALGLIPVIFIYYSSLVFFSSSNLISRVANAVIILLTPVLFVYFA